MSAVEPLRGIEIEGVYFVTILYRLRRIADMLNNRV
jgi:hypothetical protein